MNPDKRKISTTTDGKPPREGYEDAAAPAPINPETGQHEAYWVDFTGRKESASTAQGGSGKAKAHFTGLAGR